MSDVVFDNNTDYIYSETVCLELCYQTYMYEQCGCIYPIYFYLNHVFYLIHFKIISFSFILVNN